MIIISTWWCYDVGEQTSGVQLTEPRYFTATSKTSPSGTHWDSGQPPTSTYSTKNELPLPGLLPF